jgi:hypothetical protein
MDANRIQDPGEWQNDLDNIETSPNEYSKLRLVRLSIVTGIRDEGVDANHSPITVEDHTFTPGENIKYDTWTFVTNPRNIR